MSVTELCHLSVLPSSAVQKYRTSELYHLTVLGNRYSFLPRVLRMFFWTNFIFKCCFLFWVHCFSYTHHNLFHKLNLQKQFIGLIYVICHKNLLESLLSATCFGQYKQFTVFSKFSTKFRPTLFMYQKINWRSILQVLKYSCV